MAHSLYNLHRHRKHVKHKKSFFFDRFMFVIAIMGPIMTIPQVYEMWASKKVEGFSIITWSSYAVISVFWLMHGIVHKDKPILINSASILVLNVLILVGIFLFQK